MASLTPRRSVSNIPGKMTSEFLSFVFGIAGAIRDIKIIPDTLLATAYINYEERSAAEYAVNQLNGTNIAGYQVIVRWPYMRLLSEIFPPDHHHIRIVPIIHLSKDEVQLLFSTYGRVVSVRLFQENALVTFDSFSAAETAMNSLNGTNIGRSKVEIHWCSNNNQIPLTFHEWYNRAPESWKVIKVRGYGISPHSAVFSFVSGRKDLVLTS